MTKSERKSGDRDRLGDRYVGAAAAILPAGRGCNVVVNYTRS